MAQAVTGHYATNHTSKGIQTYSYMFIFFFDTLATNATQTAFSQVTSALPSTDVRSSKNTKVQKNIVVMLVGVSLCFLACWTMRSTQFLLENLGIQDGTKNYGGFVHEFGTLLIFTNILTNPFIYFFTLKNLREAAKSIFCRRCS